MGNESSRAYERIIVLDEHNTDREKTVSVLSELLPEAQIESVDNVASFRQSISENSFDIVVLDHSFSFSDGVELIHELRLKEWDPAILVVSTSTDPQHVVEAYNSGCHRCVVKQGNWTEELPSAVRHLLRVRRLEEENARLVAKLTEANSMLAEKNRRLDEFSGTVAHDIRGPLGGISMKLEYIKDIYGEDFDERFRKIIDGTMESTRRLIGIVQAMYEYAKLGSRASKTKQIELITFIEEIIKDLSFDESLDIRIGIGDLPIIWGNPGLLRKVFQNLISNAVKYGDKRTTIINISCNKIVEKSLGRFAEIKVDDNGPGISIEDQKDIFTMFRRGNAAEGKEGIGIGLSVVKRIVELHFGTIDVQSEEGKGTSFVFLLPLEEVDLQA